LVVWYLVKEHNKKKINPKTEDDSDLSTTRLQQLRDYRDQLNAISDMVEDMQNANKKFISVIESKLKNLTELNNLLQEKFREGYNVGLQLHVMRLSALLAGYTYSTTTSPSAFVQFLSGR